MKVLDPATATPEETAAVRQMWGSAADELTDEQLLHIESFHQRIFDLACDVYLAMPADERARMDQFIRDTEASRQRGLEARS